MKIFGLELKTQKQEATSVSINSIEEDIFLKVNKMVFFFFSGEQYNVKEDFIYDGNRVCLNAAGKNMKDIKCLMVPET